ncbi:hypothetical protein MO867_01150 [Microbulbifer sp. OS29]|uniref:Uncharacterized protein n=1 Tax=Microbulbifer okhotskensis TaxID=2926617 RepID=A0A9X2EJP6_9GAMM|nr:hypothetical protein [Microbulbifer okhotskensis]MCO1332934.1 hypothetical protein [Microbulbifer okhotskensis]
MSYKVIFTGEIRGSAERRHAIAALGREFGLGFGQIKGLLAGLNPQIKVTEDRGEACQMMKKFWLAGWHTQLCLGDQLMHCTVKSSNSGDPPLPSAFDYLQSVDKAISIGVPSGWQAFDNLNNEAELQAGSAQSNRYLIVLRQLRKQLPQSLTIDEFGTAQIQQCLARVANGKLISGPRSTQSNDLQGCVFEMSADVANTPVCYQVTFFQNQESFYSVFLWSDQESFPKSKIEFVQIFATFKAVTNRDKCVSTTVPA